MVDVPTLLGCSAVFLLCVSLLVAALRPDSTRGLWFALPFLAGACGCALLVRPELLPGRLGLQLGTFAISLAYAFAWQAMRAFHGNRPRWVLLLGPSLAWLVLAILLFGPQGWATPNAWMRIGLATGYSALAARELWLHRDPGLPSVRRLSILFMVIAALGAIRLVLAHWTPQPLGAAPTETWTVVSYNVQVLVQVLLATALIVSMHKERAALRYYDESVRDPMTGLYNRRFFQQRAAEWNRQAARQRAVLYFDIDRFKRINDRFGHELGDSVIVAAARVARGTLRKGDWVFRFGGEEFVCVLPDAGLEEATASAERFRQAFAAAAMEVDGQPVGASVSVGVAASGGKAVDIETLLSEADRRLYAAKAAGRNRVVADGPTPAPSHPGRRRGDARSFH
ncbi:GGDEF domain-containing protein [Lysobacter sp. GX 14042]|uniref:GGDEF domain-containing protein n=1 Tax=Lysobacter sp. GX 14042 TaxID=2907155 RepID=UPI001F46DDA2|nr:GGDEF domain-containing protein [Lysobacter sp. GX 14042]MCE7032466.1 GGDEF domain-containing protein [Lysobacter sp. GX 14042]